MQKIDPNSQEFQAELQKTFAFTQKVVKQFGYEYNPDIEIVESVRMGLTRNKLIYGKRYCPCFFVTHTKEDRICPCMPAVKHEIPQEGKCHCGIFCTPKYAESQKRIEDADAAVHEHTRGLSKDECEAILSKEQLDSDELVALLEARAQGSIDFALVDVREWMENQSARIVGTDFLVPTTSFYNSVEELQKVKEKWLVVYCHVGSRSAYCQRVLKDFGYKCANLSFGIVSYRGEIEKGRKK